MTEHIRGIIAGFLNDLKKKKSDKDRIFQTIRDIIDPNTKPHIKDFQLKQRQIFFYVDSAVWGYQLNLLKPQMLDILQKKFPNQVDDIFIKVRS